MRDLTGLEVVYGAQSTAQQGRYRQALDAFRALYGPGSALVFRAPGRVNLIGEHTDYNDGLVFPLALDLDTLLVARPRCDAIVRMANIERVYQPFEFTISQEVPRAPRGDWSNYVRGPAQLLAQQAAPHNSPPKTLCGFDGLVAGAAPHGVPRGSGLSSSSALTVASAVALTHLNGAEPQGADLARYCAQAEWYVGTRGGIMDHFIAILARRDHAMYLDCRPGPDGAYHTRHVSMPSGYRLMVVDSRVHHDNARGEFNLRVAACRAGVAVLREHFPGITHLRDVQAVPWAELEALLPEHTTPASLASAGIGLGDIPGLTPYANLAVRARCRHVHSENTRVLETVAALQRADISRVGALLDGAHESARNDYEVSCPELEILVEAAHEVPGVAGARLTGAGWGGCIIALVPEDVTQEFENHVRSRYLLQTGRVANMFACRPASGAGLVAAF